MKTLGVRGAVYRLIAAACERASPAAVSYPWWRDLPEAWRVQAVEPLDFKIYREPALAAERVFGRDEDGVACFYAHRYLVPPARPGAASQAYGETLSAWRLGDQRWLIHRVLIQGEQSTGRGFYTLSETMPG